MGEAGWKGAPEGVGTAAEGRGGNGSYEPPTITVLGSLADLTQGNSEGTTDGTFPGSLLR